MPDPSLPEGWTILERFSEQGPLYYIEKSGGLFGYTDDILGWGTNPVVGGALLVLRHADSSEGANWYINVETWQEAKAVYEYFKFFKKHCEEYESESGLLACPFCGSYNVEELGKEDPSPWVSCLNCLTSGPLATDEKSAHEQWNTRSVPKPWST